MRTANNPLTVASNLIDTDNRKHLEELFLKLQPNSPALWGKMKPQQMVEHLIDQVQYTNGKKEPFCEVSEEQAQIAKQINVYTAVEIPRNVIFGEISDQLIYPDLPGAIQQLMTELEVFDQHFIKPGTLVIHGGFGPMNYNEWCIWHSKHFSHHLKQFKIPAPPLLH